MLLLVRRPSFVKFAQAGSARNCFLRSCGKGLGLNELQSRAFGVRVLEKKNVEYVEGKSKIVTNRDLINENYGLKKFMEKTILYTGGSVLGSVAFGSLLAGETATANPVVFAGVGFTLGYIGMFGSLLTKYKIRKDTVVDETDNNKKVEILVSENSIERLASSALFLGGVSIFCAPIIATAPELVVPTLLASSSVFSTALLVAYAQPAADVGKWESGLLAGSGGLLASLAVILGSEVMIGPNIVSGLLYNYYFYSETLLFSGMIVYETYLTMKMYEEKVPDHLGAALNFYFDLVELVPNIGQLLLKKF